MKKALYKASALSVLLSLDVVQQAYAQQDWAQINPIDQVRPFAGTSNSRWMIFPGPTLPMSMVKLSPDNQANVWNGGYEYTVSSISGFSFLHNMAMRSFALMPFVGPLSTDPTSSKFNPGAVDGPFGIMWTSGWRSRFDKAAEKASPGYYSVDLMEPQVKVELTATERTGLLRMTYPKSDQAYIFIDFDPPAEEQTLTKSVTFKQVSPTRFEGEMQQSDNYTSDFTLYFVLETDVPVISVQTWQNHGYSGHDTNYGTAWRQGVTLKPLEPDFKGLASSGAILKFDTRSNPKIQTRAGLSLVSIDNARQNLSAETKALGWDFEAEHMAARAAWAEKLKTVEVSQENPNRAQTYYTDMYRVYAAKAMLDDINGQYRDYRGEVAHLNAPADHVYSSDAAWGWQWTQGPMWSLLDPKMATSVSNGLLALSDHGGWIPQAPVNMRYSSIMGAQHQNSLIIAAIQKDEAIDAQKAFKAIYHDLTTPGVAMAGGQFAGDRHLQSYMTHGYIADEDGPQSSTFEYSYDDWCAGQLALKLGKSDAARFFLHRAQSWKNAFDRGVVSARRKKADGTWVEPFDAKLYGTVGGWNGPGFMEGNAETYSFFVPQDPQGLIKMMGADNFNKRLQLLFDTKAVDVGNEPSLGMPFLFNASGRPDLTQKYVRQILSEDYDTSPYRGWIGEEDEGQLSAWYVLVALGLFEEDGGCAVHPAYDLTSPLFQKAIIHLTSQAYGPRDLIIDSEGPQNASYIRSISFNGRPITDYKLAHSELIKGGHLHFILSDTPNSH